METSKTMIIGIHPDQMGKDSYSVHWDEALRSRGIEVHQLNLLAPDALQQAAACDGVMWRWAHTPKDKRSAQRILYTIEHYLHVPVFPDSRTAWHFDEKISQFYLLQALQAPTPQTWIFWDMDEALQWAATAPYPLVFKLSTGAGSWSVVRLEQAEKTVHLIRRCFRKGIFPHALTEVAGQPSHHWNWATFRHLLYRSWEGLRYGLTGEYPSLPGSSWWQPERDYAYFQEFLPGNEFDTRISVVGERAFGFRRLNRPGDFRASGSGRIVYDPEAIDPRCIRIAFDISEKGQFQSMAYDFLMKDGRPVIGEISYAFVSEAVAQCPGHWKRDLSWVDGKMRIEQAQVEDFIQRIQTQPKPR